MSEEALICNRNGLFLLCDSRLMLIIIIIRDYVCMSCDSVMYCVICAQIQVHLFLPSLIFIGTILERYLVQLVAFYLHIHVKLKNITNMYILIQKHFT